MTKSYFLPNQIEALLYAVKCGCKFQRQMRYTDRWYDEESGYLNFVGALQSEDNVRVVAIDPWDWPRIEVAGVICWRLWSSGMGEGWELQISRDDLPFPTPNYIAMNPWKFNQQPPPNWDQLSQRVIKGF